MEEPYTQSHSRVEQPLNGKENFVLARLMDSASLESRQLTIRRSVANSTIGHPWYRGQQPAIQTPIAEPLVNTSMICSAIRKDSLEIASCVSTVAFPDGQRHGLSVKEGYVQEQQKSQPVRFDSMWRVSFSRRA